jgi:hypothetical protein
MILMDHMICDISYDFWSQLMKPPKSSPKNSPPLARPPSSSPYPLTSGQIRAARALLRWRAEDLAQASAIGVATIRRAELSGDETTMTAANDLAVRRALEAAGIEFIDENGGGPGVRSKRSKR